MRQILGLGGLFLSVMTPMAVAQDLTCQRPPPPVVAQGATAELLQMQASRDTVGIYMDIMKLYLDCLANEHENARIEANTILNQLEAETRAYNEK